MPFRDSSRSFRSRFARFANGFALAWPHAMQALLPNACALCGNLSHRPLCAFCDESYWNDGALRCRVCAVPLPVTFRGRRTSYRCGDCSSEMPPFDATFALADYRAPLDALAVGLKFRAQLMLAGEFARRLARLAQDAWQDPSDCPDVIAPVPLARRRLIERGYNQAWQIARPLARALRVPANATLLRRVIETAPQSRLDLDARRMNVGRAFQLTRNVERLHVGIVDDVMTTGATLEALARTLKAAGARRVTNFVALRTPKN
ncbi:ComF family protein [bacterium M00.F.Ca.ET.228.01.1.1]|uniref:ComF family protein n=1 Tax=Paraburkholderia phenoliruptrix TaxID=252970 RepID=UPI0010921332|nr:ComF family protein [Paraburkholderia phenoliruptrix]MBW9099859.1 ComF family protein [Paraburkholderia phenoliruptrix]TGP45190.1 ComF family protein [bacterium M00.F.Ca.ET.228.01.1.1]TGS03073.1 ComF family protein [bacterium M00.F.Ca.ET.191.01.1.1]TGU06455.1 ComF family protein [bacterium M00.F.Ca.ET.155.01.1.1]